MDFEWTEEQRLYREQVVRFAQRELAHDVVSGDLEGTFSRAAWERCANFGIQGLPVPEAYGGSGADALTTVMALEALGYGCADNGLIFSLNAQLWACEIPIIKFGMDDQKREYLPGLCDGSLIAAHGMSEPDAGSDAFSLRTTARKEGEHYILNGSKTFVTNGPLADVFVVFATMNRELGMMGLCAFLLTRDTPGVSVGPPLHKMGLRTSPMGELFLEDCEVPESQILGEPGGGAAVFNSAMQWERGCILACTVGTMERQLEKCLAYTRERKQFGRSIGSFQAISSKIVDMKLRLEVARALLYRFGWLLDSGKATALDSSLVKLLLSESFLQSSLDALQIHGGYGYMAEYEFERDVRDAIGSRIYSGTSEMQRNIAAQHLGL